MVLTTGCCCCAGERYSSTVAKVQVGLLGPTEALKRDLDDLAARADTSSRQGRHRLLQGAPCPRCTSLTQRPRMRTYRCKAPRTCPTCTSALPRRARCPPYTVRTHAALYLMMARST
jgi:predicted Zn-ribbon and HTH transcriptional regulator